nr:hypothetical protein [Allomuricauda sp.]
MVQSRKGTTKVGNAEYKNRHIRRFLRVLSGLVLIFYVAYFMASKIISGTANLDWVDGLIAFFAFSILVTIESVRAYARRKLERMDK